MKGKFQTTLMATTILAATWASPLYAAGQPPAGAQARTPATPGQQDDAPVLQDIVVTAQKRSESLQRVPISVAAVGKVELHDGGIKKIEDLQYKVPNLTLAESGIGTSIGIRGIFSGINQGFEQSVGIFIDGIYYGRAQQARAPFLDLDRVEVLRGPQSILFGKNAIAGALNIITARPEKTFGGYGTVSYGTNAHDVETTGAITGPISDSIRFRLAGRYHNSDGYMRNLTLDHSEAKRDDWQLRGIMEADLTSNLTLTLKAEAGEFNVTGRENEIIGETPAALPASDSASSLVNGLTYAQILTNTGTAPINSRIAALNAATGMQLMPLPVADSSVLNTVQDGKRSSNSENSTNKSQTYLMKLEWLTGLGTVTAISGYNRFKTGEVCDCDFTGAPILTASLQENYKQFSQELRLVSNRGGAFDYIVGGFFQWSKDEYSDQTNVGADSTLLPLIFNQAYAPAFQSAAQAWLAANPGDTAGAISAGQTAGTQAGAAGLALADTRAARTANVSAKVGSIFGQLTWHASDVLRLTLGSRLNYESKDGRRNMVIQTIDGSTLSGSQAVLAPIAYAGTFGITSQNLTQLAAAGNSTAQYFVESLGALPTSGQYSKWRFTPSVTVQYDAGPSTMLYANWVTGAKSGGFDYRGNNKGAAATMDQAFEFGDEKAMTFEGGVKTRLLGGRAEFNAAAYYTDYKDLQVSIFDGRLGFNVGNAAKARIYGLELESRVRINPELSASGSFAWTDFKFREFPLGQCYSGQTPNGPDAALGYCDYKGKRAQFVPRTSGTLALDYTHPISNSIDVKASTAMFYTGNYYADPSLHPSLIQGAYARFDIRLALAAADDEWEIAVLAKNITDKKPMTYATATPLAYSVFGARSTNAFFGEGRTFVMQAKVNF